MTRVLLAVLAAAVIQWIGSVAASGLSDAKVCKATVERGDNYLGINLCTRAINSGELSPENLAIIFNTRGVAFKNKGQYDRAIQDYNTAIRLKPNHVTAFYNRGVAYKQKGQYNRAIQDYDTAIRLKPDYAFAYGNRGSVYEALGQREQALRDFKKQYDLGSHPKWLVDKLKKYGALQ